MKHFKDRKNWTSEGKMNPETGKHWREYYFKRKRAPKVVIDTHLSRQLAGYTLIEKDLRTIQGWLKRAAELQQRDLRALGGQKHILADDYDEDEIVKALFLSAIIFYGKCFAECKGRYAKLERKNIGKEFLDTHDYLISMRNNYGAHSGEEKMESVNIVYVLNPNKKYRHEKHALVRELIQPESMYQYDDQEHDFVNLLNHLTEFVLAKTDKLNDLIFERDINPKGIGYWYRMAKRV